MNELIFIILVLVIAIFLSTIHYLSDIFSKIMEKHHYDVLSFSGGTLIAYIFLVLFPEVLHISDSAEIFLLILLGFIVFHITEKFLYQHVKNKREMLKELKELHTLGFFLDHLILGFVLVTTLKFSEPIGYLLILPIFMHTISSSITMEHIHEKAKTKINKIILSASPLIGAIIALILEIGQYIQGLILAFIIGMLLYIVGKDVLPKEEKGQPLMFIIGVTIILLTWLILI